MDKEFLTDLKLLKEQKTKFQTIRLYETKDKKLIMTLNTFVQFKSGEDEQNYHNAITKSAFERNANAKDFLILGGGDGLVARNLLQLNSQAKITLVELDEEVVKLCRTNKRLRELNNNSLNKCKIIIEDALKYVPDCKDKYDIIICDFPDANNSNIEQLYKKKFLSQVIKLLNKNGVISIQCHPNIAGDVLLIINDLVKKVKCIEYEMPFLVGGCIVLGVNEL